MEELYSSGGKVICPSYLSNKKGSDKNIAEVLFPEFDLAKFGTRKFMVKCDPYGNCVLTGEELIKLSKEAVTKSLTDSDTLFQQQ